MFQSRNILLWVGPRCKQTLYVIDTFLPRQISTETSEDPPNSNENCTSANLSGAVTSNRSALFRLTSLLLPQSASRALRGTYSYALCISNEKNWLPALRAISEWELGQKGSCVEEVVDVAAVVTGCSSRDTMKYSYIVWSQTKRKVNTSRYFTFKTH